MAKGEPSEAIKRHLARSSLRLESKPQSVPERVVIYARASSAEHKEKLERQVERLVQYCTLRGYEARTGGQGNCLRGERQPPETLGVAQRSAGHRIVVEHKDRFNRFGFRYLETLLEYKVEPLKSRVRADNDKEDLIADLVATSTH